MGKLEQMLQYSCRDIAYQPYFHYTNYLLQVKYIALKNENKNCSKGPIICTNTSV